MEARIDNSKTRVLVWGLSNSLGGTEGVIANYSRALKEKVTFDYIVYEEPNNYSDLFEDDNRFFIIPSKGYSISGYYKDLRGIFEEHANEYSAVWCNLNILNNIDVLKLGCKYEIPKRILHAHNSQQSGKLHQRLLSKYHARDIDKYVTDYWACSEEAAHFLYGDRNSLVLPNAIYYEKFSYSHNKREDFRNQFELGDSVIIGTIGRLSKQKNHLFLLEIFARYLKDIGLAKLVIVGEGEERSEIESQILALNLQENVILTGEISDVQKALSAFDVFVFPSLYEGLPLGFMEAQANGLTCLASDAVSQAASISKDVYYLPLGDTALWVEAIAKSLKQGRINKLDERSAAFDMAKQKALLSEVFK